MQPGQRALSWNGDERRPKRRGPGHERRRAGDRPRALGRHGAPADRALRPGAGERPLRGARRARRPGQLRPLHHVRDDRRRDRGDGAAAAHARAARRDARVRRVAPHARHQARPALPRLVAVRPPGDALLHGRADRGRRRSGGRVLPHRQGGRRRVHGRRPGADRDARSARRAGDGERAPVRAQPRAEHRGGAQPAGARPARLAGAEAVRRGARGEVRLDAARARRRRCPRAGGPARRARTGRDLGAALAGVPAAAGRDRDRGPGGGAPQARGRAAARPLDDALARAVRDSAPASGRGRRGVPDRTGGAPQRAPPRPRRARRGPAGGERRGPRAVGLGRRRGLRPERGGAAVAPAGAHLDGGAGARAGRAPRDRVGARAPGTIVRLEMGSG